MKIITGYSDTRKETEVIEFDIEIIKTGKRYRVKASKDGKLRLSAREGYIVLSPEAPNLIEIDQVEI